jgi:hypothetical protein
VPPAQPGGVSPAQLGGVAPASTTPTPPPELPDKDFKGASRKVMQKIVPWVGALHAVSIIMCDLRYLLVKRARAGCYVVTCVCV